MENEFGKVVFIAREKITEGYLLRQTRSGVILEFYIPEQQGVDVVANFDNTHISNDRDFRMCLTEARKFMGNMDEPIQVDLNVRNIA